METGRLLRVPADELRGLMEQWLPLAVHLIRGVFGTARSIESTVRQRESLVTLGTLAAGLAHELNNPAAAAVRTVDAMADTCNALLTSLDGLAQGSITAEQFLELDKLRLRSRPAARALRAAARDAEDELADWLARRGVEEGWGLASTLARRASTSGGATGPRTCSRARRCGPASVGPGTLAMGTLLGSFARRRAGSPSWSTPCAPTPRSTGRPSSRSTWSRASRARW